MTTDKNNDMRLLWSSEVMCELPYMPNVADTIRVWDSLRSLYNEGFTKEDAVAYCMCMEEVSPDMYENVALAKMSKIRAKYITHS